MMIPELTQEILIDFVTTVGVSRRMFRAGWRSHTAFTWLRKDGRYGIVATDEISPHFGPERLPAPLADEVVAEMMGTIMHAGRQGTLTLEKTADQFWIADYLDDHYRSVFGKIDTASDRLADATGLLYTVLATEGILEAV